MLGIYYVSINFSTLVEINVVASSLLGIATSFIQPGSSKSIHMTLSQGGKIRKIKELENWLSRNTCG